MILQQISDCVTGQVNLNSARFALREGIVVGNTLRFKVVRAPLPYAANLPDEFVGVGELVMDRGGKTFKGTVLGVATSGTLIAR